MYRISIVVLLVFFHDIATFEYPAFLKEAKCHIKHEDYEQCFVTNGNKIIPLIARGVPELNIPNMMPFNLPFLQLINEPNLHLNLTNVNIFGLENLILLNARIKVDEGEMKLATRTKNITITGDYSADGRISTLPVKGEGPFTIYLENGSFNQTMYFEAEERSGETYFVRQRRRKSIYIDFHLQGIVFNFENLFDGNKQLGDTVNEFLNQNWEVLIDEFGPSIKNIMEKFLAELSFDKFENVPVREIFYLD